MKTRTLALCAALLVLLAAGVWSASAATDSTDERLIHASGTGEVTTTPDRAVISFAVETQNTDPKVAQTANAAAMDGVIAALKAAGIAPEDLKTTGYNIYPEKQDETRPFGGSTIVYHVTNTLEVTLNDVTRTGEIIDLAVSNGANRVNNLYFTLSTERQQQFRSEALTKAVDQARSDADAVAVAADMTITGVKEISIGGTYVPMYGNYRAYDMVESAAGAVPTPIETGDVKVTASVSITYLCR
ncbi:SIMPL domain-containing protein [Methanofollis fontis]|uniref:SIMPL domain-containing protein n=1 Tax=Methanofollis fontis TaxID=2052832 RepID=A0A483CLS4_9EURY|nr:SIMPL domain-containing protein [Methanofollis fontis]TAJ43432.1 SIMPL domain-containing protein [Methanofollis fontis]